MKNEHAQSIPAETLAQAVGLAEELLTLLSPYFLSLTPDQRKSMLKMGDKTLGFVEKAAEFAAGNPSLCPPYLNLEDFKIDVDDAIGLRGLLNKLQQLTYGTDDTMMVAGGEAYNAALVFYASVKGAAKQNVPGAKAVYEELRKRFPGRGKAQSNQEVETE